MKIIKNAPEGVISDIFDFIEKDIKLSKTESDIKYFLEMISNKIISMDEIARKNVIQELVDYSFFDLSKYNIKDYSDNQIFRAMMFFGMIKHTLKVKFIPEYKEEFERFEEMGRLERQISPPLSAYEYKSGNEITYSDMSYGLLFE